MLLLTCYGSYRHVVGGYQALSSETLHLHSAHVKPCAKLRLWEPAIVSACPHAQLKSATMQTFSHENVEKLGRTVHLLQTH